MRVIPFRQSAWGLLLLLACVFALCVPVQAMAEPVIATGTVTDADTTDPIEGAWVDVGYYDEDVDEWYWVDWTETDSNGEYTLYDYNGAGANDYYIEVSARGYSGAYENVTWNGSSALDVDFALDPATVLATGTVTDADTTDPIEGAVIWVDVYDEDAEEWYWVDGIETDSNGEYTLYDMMGYGAGDYQFYAVARAYVNAQTVETWDGGDPLEVKFALVPAVAVCTGTVTDAVTDDPIEGADVSLAYYDEGEDQWFLAGYAFTDENGEYLLYDEYAQGAGDYLIAAWAWGYDEQSIDEAWDGSELLQRDFALEPIAADAYEPDDVPEQATLIIPNAVPQEHTIAPAGDEDWVRLHAFKGVTYVFETTISDWWMDSYLYLYKADGSTLIAENDDSGESVASKITWKATEDTVVYAKVTHYDTEWGIGSYGLKVIAGNLPPVVPVQGDDRFATAVEVSRKAFPGGADTIVIATGRNWPDALGGTSLAGALGGPVLLVDTNVIPAVVVSEIDRLGATNAVILGGTAAVGTAVEDALKMDLGSSKVERIFGANRYETADKVAARTITELGEGYDGTAFVATGGNFPDALAAAPLASAQGWPLFLANPTTGLSAATKSVMGDVESVLILGGEAVVKPETATYLSTTFGADNVTRLFGADRYKTAVAVATYAVDEVGHVWDRVGITTGQNYPDALAGGVLQGRVGSVMLLTKSNELNPDTGAALTANKGGIDTVTFFGGANAVQQTVRDAVANALK